MQSCSIRDDIVVSLVVLAQVLNPRNNADKWIHHDKYISAKQVSLHSLIGNVLKMQEARPWNLIVGRGHLEAEKDQGVRLRLCTRTI